MSTVTAFACSIPSTMDGIPIGWIRSPSPRDRLSVSRSWPTIRDVAHRLRHLGAARHRAQRVVRGDLITLRNRPGARRATPQADLRRSVPAPLRSPPRRGTRRRRRPPRTPERTAQAAPLPSLKAHHRSLPSPATAAWRDRSATIGRCNDGVRTLQNDHRIALRAAARARSSFEFDFGDGCRVAEQSGEFAFVRGQDHALPRPTRSSRDEGCELAEAPGKLVRASASRTACVPAHTVATTIALVSIPTPSAGPTTQALRRLSASTRERPAAPSLRRTITASSLAACGASASEGLATVPARPPSAARRGRPDAPRLSLHCAGHDNRVAPPIFMPCDQGP